MERIKTKIKSVSDNLQSSIAEYQKSSFVMRPWLSDYLNPSKFSKPYKKEACRRVKENLKYFLKNYLLTEMILMSIGIISQAIYFLALVGLVVLWYIVYFSNNVRIRGKEIPLKLRIAVMVICSVIFCAYLAWDMLVYSLMIMAIFITVHSIYHELPPSTTSI